MRKSFSNIIISKPAIVFDLDDTLVYATLLQPNDLDNKHFFTIIYNRRKLYVQTRPNLKYFLERISKLYDIYFYTSSTKEYANLIIDKIMPDIKQNHRFFRDSCINVYGYYVKDLNLIRRPLKQILLVDDSSGSALKNPKNLVKIEPWQGEKDDKVLLNLLGVLENIALESDIRSSFLEIVKNEKLEGINTF